MCRGSIQSRLGVAAPPLMSATAANSARIASSAPSSQRWVSALSSIPTRQIQVISPIHTHPASVTRPGRVGGRLPADEQERVAARDLGEAGHHDHVRGHDRPARQPADPRAHRPSDPREARARVGVGAVHPLVGERDAQHRQERHEQDRRSGQPDARHGDDEAECGRQAVGRGGRRGRDHDVGRVRDRVGLQAVLARRGALRCASTRRGIGGGRHGLIVAGRSAPVVRPSAELRRAPREVRALVVGALQPAADRFRCSSLRAVASSIASSAW
jgi:hypothetical protein